MNQALSESNDDLASRLRMLRSRNGLTTQDMSDATGIPKRTLESYMLKKNAALPGIEALKKLSIGLETSLDWLVFGGNQLGKDQSQIVRVFSRSAILPFLRTIVKEYRRGSTETFETDTILGLSPEDLAAELAAEAGDNARSVIVTGVRMPTINLVEKTMNSRDGL